MEKFTLNGQDWIYEIRENNTVVLLTPMGSTLVLRDVQCIISHGEIPTVEDIIWNMKFNDNVIPRSSEEDINDDFLTPNVHKDPYYLRWGHTYQAIIHDVNCNNEEDIPVEYKNKSIEFNNIKVIAFENLGNKDILNQFLKDHGFDLVMDQSISLWFRYDENLNVKDKSGDIIRAFTEDQLRSSDAILVGPLYARTEVKKDYVGFKNSLLLKYK